MPDTIFLTELEATCIIGIFDWERKVRQKILVDLEIPADARKAAKKDSIEATVDYKSIAKFTLRFVSESRFHLIETLAERLAGELLAHFKLEAIKVRISKPGAVRGSRNVGIEIERRSPLKKQLAFKRK